jgi:(5-formylfuran-3-yl)methyl phosphate synthase
MTVSNLSSLTDICQRAGVQVALAGSLQLAEIAALRSVRPNWFAVRGAACSGGRNGTIDEHRVRQLKELISVLESASYAADD